MEEVYEFKGSVPEFYDALFGAQLFEPYARDLLSHIPDTFATRSVLELGCGTGRCTQQILVQLKGLVELTATDISQEMLNFASRAVGSTSATISWETVDECDLPFGDNKFDMVICQFGYMFCSDKEKAFAESVRVLRPGGMLLFNVWGSIEKNPLCFIADRVLKASHPHDHDDFFKLPYSMHDQSMVSEMLESAGLENISVQDESIKCYWGTPHEAAAAIIDGSPISLILKSRGEDAQPLVDQISAAYREHHEQQQRVEKVGAENEASTSSDLTKIGFDMTATVYLSFKPIP